MATPPGRENLGRGHRRVKKSKKAREIDASGQTTPGIPSPGVSSMASTHSAPPKTDRGRPPKRSVGAALQQALAPTAASPATIDYDGHTYRLPNFGANTMLIYQWLHPQPTSHVQLPEFQRRFKETEDARQKAADVDDGADDWDMFAGPFAKGGANASLFSVAASVFIKRAKRAFWSGKTWDEFERAELELETDEDELPNEIRLAIFDQLKVRMCEEIWSQEYPGPQDSKVPSPQAEGKRAVQALPSAAASYGINKHDTAPPAKKQRILPPTAEQAERGITGMAIDRYGTRQPLYEDEIEPPSMDALLAENRRHDQQRRGETDRGTRDRRQTRDELRYATHNGVSLSGERFAAPTFEMSMQQAQEDMATSDEGEAADFGA